MENNVQIPLALQIYLWKQLSAFTRPKLGKFHESLCSFCQHAPGHHELKESCKTFEKIFVQNIFIGISPKLSDALLSFPRWKLIQISLPYIMHCSASLLSNKCKDSSMQNLGAFEAKMLYTLHWVLLDSADECYESDMENGENLSSPFQYIFPLSAISLFVYLFAPICSNFKESDFFNFRLENGLKIWKEMWKYRHPNGLCFTVICKQSQNDFRHKVKSIMKYKNDVCNDENLQSNLNNTNTEPSSNKNTVNSFATSENLSNEDESVVELQLSDVPDPETFLKDPTIYRAEHDILELLSSKKKEKQSSEGQRKVLVETVFNHVSFATVLDVSTIQCLFVNQWQESGIHWALNFLLRRLIQLKKFICSERLLQKRSFSVPNINDLHKNKLFNSKTTDFFFDPISNSSKLKGFAKKNTARVDRFGTSKMRFEMEEKNKNFSKSEKDLSKKIGFDTRSLEQLEQNQNIERGKSLPSVFKIDESIAIETFRKKTSPKRTPIITITEYTPETSPKNKLSFSETFNRLTSSDKLKTSRNRYEPLSKSDSNALYVYDGCMEIPGSQNFITSEGYINISMVIKGLHFIVHENTGNCSIRVIDLILKIFQVFIDFDKLSIPLDCETKTEDFKEFENFLKSTPIWDEYFDSFFNTKQLSDPFEIILKACLRLYRHLGCPHGCLNADGVRGIPAESLRAKIQSILIALKTKDRKKFSKQLKKYIHTNTIFTILEFFHSYLGYCTESNSTLSLQSSLYKGIEDEVVSIVIRPTIEKLMKFVRECRVQDSLELYYDIRQLVCFFKDEHSLLFRKIMLCALIDSSTKEVQKSTTQTFRIIKTPKVPQKLKKDKTDILLEEIFNKRKKDVSSYFEVFSENEKSDEYKKPKKKQILTPKQSERNFNELNRQQKRNFKKFQLKGSRSSEREEKQKAETSLLDDNKVKRRNINRTLQNAKKHLELTFEKYVFKTIKSKDSCGSDSQKNLSRKSSIQAKDVDFDSSFVKLRKSSLVNVKAIFHGTKIFSFLLEMNYPGTLPEPFILASCLDLPKTPVLAKAALLLECAYFVHCCNKNQWAPWMKLNFPLFRPSGCLPNNKSTTSGARKLHLVQQNAGKLFHQWAEIIGIRLEEFYLEDQERKNVLENDLNDEQNIQKIIDENEEENFLDEETLKHYGTNCPIALRMIACVLLSEITTFLRETYRNLPKLGRKDRCSVWDKANNNSNRRWSTAYSSIANSNNSAQSFQSISNEKDFNQTSERKISFVLHEPDNESENSNTNDEQDKSKKMANMTRQCLLRKGVTSATNNSIKKRSLKLRRNTKENKDLIDVEALQSKRKVSSMSDRSDFSDQLHVTADVSGEDSSGGLSDDQHTESPSDTFENDETAQNMPWIKAIVMTMNTFDFQCTHQIYCHPYCYRRHIRSASKLMAALRKTFSKDFEMFVEEINDTNFRDLKQSHKFPSSPSTKSNIQKEDKRSKNKNNEDESNTKTEEITEEEVNEMEDSEIYQKSEEKTPILKYIHQRVLDAFHSPLNLLLKAAVLLNESHYMDMVSVLWDLLLEEDRETVAAAASLFILCSIKIPKKVSEIMTESLTHPNQNVKVAAVFRFQVLWKVRYQVWPRMEDSAHMDFKVPPSGIEFTLPSPKIGIESLPVVDAPWMPQMKSNVEEVTIDQDHRALVTTTKSRKKQQSELIKQALQAQIDKKMQERKKFLITTIPITVQAAHEPSLYHASGEDHEEIDEEQADCQIRGTVRHLQPAHYMFPSILCASAIDIIKLLDDSRISNDGSAVYEIAYHVIWCCLVEDSALFLRNVFESLTKGKGEQMFNILRHLIRFIPRLPQQAAFSLYNYIIGYIMFYVRTVHEESQHSIAVALSVLWMVVHSVNGIMFKDLKQILRKEQCDASILLTANVPAAKKIIVHGPQENDTGAIPSQFPIQEDTKFLQILRESLDFFSIKEEDHKNYYLIDYKTRQIHNPSSYVRDCYFFKRSQYPQLELVYMESENALNALQNQELMHKFTEIGKVHLTWAILKNVDMVVQRVVFLHEELMKLPSFPRKAMESNLELYEDGELGKILLGLDVLHKFMWVRLISRMFEAMAGNYAYSGDIHLFLDVLNGALILYTENACILRYVMATYINSAFHFKNIFANDGYFMIMPTLLKIYANHQTNSLVTTSIDFLVKQFYLLNRKPFILQLFGSVSTILDTNNSEENYGDANKVQSTHFFTLLLSLETISPDPLNISELVKDGQEIQAIDFCYHDETEMVTILDCISLCVMVISYSPESFRAGQMLIILDSLIPCYLKHIKNPDYNVDGKSEKEIIVQLSVALKTLVNNCEPLSKTYTGPYRSSDMKVSSTNRNCPKSQFAQTFEFEDESFMKFSSEYLKHKNIEDSEDSEILQRNFRRPRDILLSILSQFIKTATKQIGEINKCVTNPDTKPVELFDNKCYIRLCDIAHSLLKISPYDAETMACKGLKLFMNNIFPYLDWADDAMKPVLVTILRRLDKIFCKILKKPSIRRNTDWSAASGILKGVSEAILQNSQIIHWQYVRSLIITCQGLIISDSMTSEVNLTAPSAVLNQSPPSIFCLTIIKLILYQIIYGNESYNLEHICGGSSIFTNQEKSENFIMHLIIPLCFRSQTVDRVKVELPKIKQVDIEFALNLVLNTMNPITFKMVYGHTQNIRVVNDTRASSVNIANREQKAAVKISPNLYHLLFMALKILMVCFEDELEDEWTKIARIVSDLKKKIEASKYFLDFLDFVTTYRGPLFILLGSTIHDQVHQPAISVYERNLLSSIRKKLYEDIPISPMNRGSRILQLMQQMKDLKNSYDDNKKKEESQEKQNSVANETASRNQRPSLIEIIKGNESKILNLNSNLSGGSSNSNQKNEVKEKEVASSKNVTGEDGGGNSSIDSIDENGPRLQRLKPQSRKTFRFRKSQKSLQNFTKSQSATDNSQDIDEKDLVHEQIAIDDNAVVTAANDVAIDEDNVLSQTSSTCGYKELYSAIFETVDGEIKKPENSKLLFDYETSSAESSFSDEDSLPLQVQRIRETVFQINEKKPPSTFSPQSSSSAAHDSDEDTLI